MAYFDDHFYNPAYFNPQYYQQVKNTMIDQTMNYQGDQNERVMKTVHAFSEMLDQIEGMDVAHQQQAFGLCLLEMSHRKQWR